MPIEFNILPHPKKLLIAPLDWGLGHATRCIPLIQWLLQNGHQVTIAASGPVQQLLQQEFPEAQFIYLSGYHINYSRNKRWFNWTIAVQAPKILATIIKEHYWLKKVLKTSAFDAIISDNRFGLWSTSVPSVYITHQLQILTGSKMGNIIANSIHHWFIRCFHQCWVPDIQTTPGIAGILSHPQKSIAAVKYIGTLSRFEPVQQLAFKYNLLVLISGPEPQRSVFEQLICTQLKGYKGNVLLVRGLPANAHLSSKALLQQYGLENEPIEIENHLPAAALSKAIQSAKYIICRSGYTTVMDLIRLKKTALMVPTPGQTEQEYLAKHLQQQGIFKHTQQAQLQLLKDMDGLQAFVPTFPDAPMDLYKNCLAQFVDSL
jgi:uncharacterized protein (TIGR00661 family)